MTFDDNKSGSFNDISGIRAKESRTFVFFDIGMVLLDNADGALWWEALARKSALGMDAADLAAYYDSVPDNLMEDAGRGEVMTKDLLGRMKEILRYQGSIEELGRDFSRVRGVLGERMAVLREVQETENFHAGIISDTCEIHMDILRGKIHVPGSSMPQIFEGFRRHHLIFSYDPDVRARKSDPKEGHRPYRVAMGRLGANPEKDKVLMIDDKEACRAGAERAGMTFIHLPHGEALRPKLVAQGILPENRPAARPVLKTGGLAG